MPKIVLNGCLGLHCQFGRRDLDILRPIKDAVLGPLWDWDLNQSDELSSLSCTAQKFGIKRIFARPKHNNAAVVSVNVVRRFMTFSVGRRIPRG
jgi:hypothetical protein